MEPSMIDRYCTPAMTAIWSRQAKYERWKEVEIAICRAHTEDGTISRQDLEQIIEKASFSLERCDEIEKETRHDLAAFVRCLDESVGQAGRWIHFGVTSYDVIDTALGMMLRDSCDVLLESAGALRTEIARLEKEHEKTPMIGRTHGIHAEPITGGTGSERRTAQSDKRTGCLWQNQRRGRNPCPCLSSTGVEDLFKFRAQT